MANRVTLRVTGIDAALLKIRAFQKRKAAEFEQIAEQNAQAIKDDAQALAPVKTGLLRSSYQIERPSRFVRLVGSDVGYALYVELGTSRMAARPHLLPAYEKNRIAFLANIRTALRKL